MPRRGERAETGPANRSSQASHDVYTVTQKVLAVDGQVIEATGAYRHTVGPRQQIELYRQKLEGFGTGRVFAVKRPR